MSSAHKLIGELKELIDAGCVAMMMLSVVIGISVLASIFISLAR